MDESFSPSERGVDAAGIGRVYVAGRKERHLGRSSGKQRVEGVKPRVALGHSCRQELRPA